MAAIINCVGDQVFEELKAGMQTQPFSLMLDASYDVGIEKMFPIYNTNFKQIMTQIFHMNLLQGRDASTAESMFNSVDEQFTKHELVGIIVLH